MTKDDFLNMMNSELESLENEYEAIRQWSDYYRSLDVNGKEYQEASYQLMLCEKKIDRIKRLINLPIYVRIQAMSDIEIEEYKKDKIAELELKIEEIVAREKHAKEKLSQLGVKRSEILAQFGSLSDDERECAIYEGRQIQDEINRYNINNPGGVFAALQNEIQDIKNMQQQIKNKTSQVVKEEFLAEIEEHHISESVISEASKDKGVEAKLLVATAADPEKAHQMAKLLAEYKKLSDPKTLYVRMKFDRDTRLEFPKKLTERLMGTRYYDLISKELVLSNPDKLIEIVTEFEKNYNFAKNIYMNQFTEQKLFGLVDRVDCSKVDMPFLRQHQDKLGAGKLEYLQILVAQREKYLEKKFKTKGTKREIESLNDLIQQELVAIYGEILGWYQLLNGGILGLKSDISFDSLYSLKYSLGKAAADIDKTQQLLDSLKKYLQSMKLEMEQTSSVYETRRQEIAEQIRVLAGPEFTGADIPIPLRGNNQDILDIIASQSSSDYQDNLVDSVQQEARYQADRKEAELRGITVEQLLRMRQEVSQMNHQKMTEQAMQSDQIEASPGIKR